tara:strand:- start:56 stop:253 length:198 start_codon:yes stop_codon:yes gene_type:complete
MLDPMRCGSLSSSQLREGFRMLRIPIEDNDVNDIMASFDINGDGVLTYEEFEKFLTFPSRKIDDQ